MIFGTVGVMWGQSPSMEIAGFEYSIIPSVGETSIEKYTARLNFGKKFTKGMLGFGVSYDNYNFLYNNASIGIDAEPYKDMHSVKARLFYKHFINDSWSANIMFSPGLSSNFEGSLSSEDLQINSAATVSKSWKNDNKSSLLTFGVGYGTAFGEPRIIPVVSFRKTINAKWSYGLGVPRTHVNYQLNSRHKFSAAASFSGFFGNASSTVDFMDIGSLNDTKLQYNALNTSIEHNFKIMPNWTTVIRLGYSPWNELKVLDNENNKIYDFEADSSISITMGLKFNLNKMRNENKK